MEHDHDQHPGPGEQRPQPRSGPAAAHHHGAPAHVQEEAGHGRHGVMPRGGVEHGKHMVDHTGHEAMFRRRFWVCLVLSIPVLLYSPMLQDWFNFTMPTFPGSRWVPPVFSVAIFLYGGVPFLQMAVPEVRQRQPGMMTLISMAVSVAFVYSIAAFLAGTGAGFFWELVTLIDVMLLGHWIEMRSVRQASGALSELARLMPDTAERLLPDGATEQVPVTELRLDDTVLVRPGASIPADGEVVEGESEVSEAMITGESRPVPKAQGSRVIAGTVNGDGSLRVRVQAVGEATALARIMRLVEEAQGSRSRTQVLADRAAGWLFYTALAVAAVSAAAWAVAAGFQAQLVERVVTVLVIACPHALGLAIPLVVAIGTTLAARNGVLVRDRLALEEARRADTVVFDKTGTLTRGEFGVVGVQAAPGVDEAEALALAAAVEGDSEHTIARAIRSEAQERGLTPPPAADFQALKGRGARAVVAQRTLHVGGPRLLEQLGLTPPPQVAAFAQAAGQRGQTVVYLVEGERVLAALALADVVRPESPEAVRRLQRMGVEVAMLTGDSQAVAAAVARELGIHTFFAEVLPEHKEQKVAELQRQGRRVVMVGDGINDAPALVRADVGIAIGSGTDVAVESAGIVLVKSNPLDVVKVLELSRASYRKMVQNLLWATGYNVVALPLAAGALAPVGVLLTPALGALFMSLSTVVVAINAQLLRGVKL